MDEIDHLVELRLRRTRQRYTLGRRQLVELLAGTGRPLTMADLLAAGIDQSQSSLYRNLAVLEQCGAVHRIVSSQETASFELDEDLTEHHHHLVCDSCGGIEDLALSQGVERALRRAVGEARDRKDFAADSHRFELHGTCATCG